MKRFLLFFFCFGLLLVMLVSFSPASRAIGWDWHAISGQGILLKLLVAAGLACFLPQHRDRMSYAHPNFLIGVVLGSIGLFFFKAFYVVGMVRWPFLFLGSSVPELGSLFWYTSRLNPLFASCVIPIALMSFLGSHPSWKWLALGVSIGMMAFMLVALVSSPSMMWFGSGGWSEIYLLVNIAICAFAVRLFCTVATQP